MSSQRLVPVRSRVNIGQRAAVCGLVLAGVPFPEACSIVGLRSTIMAPYVGADWTVRTQRPSRWTHDQLDAFAEVWRDPSIKVTQIAASFNICVEQAWRVARNYGLGNRPTWKTRKPNSIAQQSTEQRQWYRKLRDEYGVKRAREITGFGV